MDKQWIDISDPEAWDDTALLKAYDDAIRGVKRSPAPVTKRLKRDTTAKQSEESNDHQKDCEREQEEEEEQENGDLVQNESKTQPLPRAPGLDNVEGNLAHVLQAYFEAGFALGKYLNKNLPADDE